MHCQPSGQKLSGLVVAGGEEVTEGRGQGAFLLQSQNPDCLLNSQETASSWDA